MKRKRINIHILLVYVVLTIYTLYTLYPIFLMIITALKNNLEIMTNPSGLPRQYIWDGFISLFRKESFGQYFLNSLFVTVVSCLILLVVSLMLAYILARYAGKVSNFLYYFFLIGMMLPLRLGLLSLNDLLYNLGLIDSLWGLVLIYVAMNIPYSMFLLSGYIRMIPASLEEQAFVDGASTWTILWKIVVPLIKPSIATTLIYNLVPIWNDAFFPLVFISTKQKRTLMQAVMLFFGQYSTNWNLVFSALTLAAVPVIIVYIICSKYLIRGMMAGAVKG